MRGQEQIRRMVEMGYGEGNADKAAIAGFIAQAGVEGTIDKAAIKKVANRLYGMLVARQMATGVSLETMAETVDRLDAMWQGSYGPLDLRKS